VLAEYLKVTSLDRDGGVGPTQDPGLWAFLRHSVQLSTAMWLCRNRRRQEVVGTGGQSETSYPSFLWSVCKKPGAQELSISKDLLKRQLKA
jgi:hypothetical protein